MYDGNVWMRGAKTIVTLHAQAWTVVMPGNRFGALDEWREVDAFGGRDILAVGEENEVVVSRSVIEVV